MNSSSNTNEITPRSGNPRRRSLFRFAAVLIGLSPLFIAEATLRVVGWQPAGEVDDPYIGFDEIHPLFVLNAEGDRYEIAQNRLAYFQPDVFSKEKDANGYRIFVLGGSTVQGRPFSTETSFTTWLKLSLQAADPNRKWEVVNCGGVSYASYRLLPILQEVLNYQPDLIILYTGHNEFLEDRTFEHIKQTPQAVARIHGMMSSSRAYSLCRGLLSPASAHEERLPSEVQAILDYEGGLAKYHRNNQWRNFVIADFRSNLQQMLRMADDAKVPVLLANSVCNLHDCRPFKVEANPELSEKQKQQFGEHWQNGYSFIESDPKRAIIALSEAIVFDDTNAGAWWDLGRCYDELCDFDNARIAYLRAKDNDVCPLRILEPMRDIIFEVAHHGGITVVDVQHKFEDKSQHRVVGQRWMIDHVHPTVDGHKMIARLFFEELERREVVQRKRDWEFKQQKLYEDHFKSLNYAYFARGRQRLEGLRLWTQGKSGNSPSPN